MFYFYFINQKPVFTEKKLFLMFLIEKKNSCSRGKYKTNRFCFLNLMKLLNYRLSTYFKDYCV